MKAACLQPDLLSSAHPYCRACQEYSQEHTELGQAGQSVLWKRLLALTNTRHWVPSTSTSRIAKSSQKTSPFLFHSHSEPAAHSAFHLPRRRVGGGKYSSGKTNTSSGHISVQFPRASPVLSVRLHYCI